MECVPRNPCNPCNPRRPSAIHNFLLKARNVCHWVGHLDDPSSPMCEFDDWLDGFTQPNCCGAGCGKACQLVDVSLYMVFKGRQAAAVMAIIMLSAINIALGSAQFVATNWSRSLKITCGTVGRVKLYLQVTVLCAMNVFFLLAVYTPVYNAFVRMIGIAVLDITSLKANVLGIALVVTLVLMSFTSPR